jgi:hypothetical protein
LRVRIGNAEFTGIGSEQVIKDQFDVFMGCLSTTPQFDPKGQVVTATPVVKSVARVTKPDPKESGGTLRIQRRFPALHWRVRSEMTGTELFP